MNQKDTCEVTCVHQEKVIRVKDQMKHQPIPDVALLLKVLADETRLKIAYALSIEEELCVCDVANIVGSSSATASHHLRQLRKHGLADFRKEGKLALYFIKHSSLKSMIASIFTQFEEVKTP